MRVLHIISGDLWAGAEAQAFTLLTSLRQIKDVVVAAVLMNEGVLAERLRGSGLFVTIIPESSHGAMEILLELRRFMLAWHPDVVHTHRVKENILGALANQWSVKAPSMRTVHGRNEHAKYGIFSIHKKVIEQFDRWCAAHLQRALIAVTKELADCLVKDVPRANIIVIENGIDIQAIRGQVRPVKFRLDQPTVAHIGIVGRLEPVKRVDIFLETAAILMRLHPSQEWMFHVFGEGSLRSALQQQAVELGVENNVVFHGHRLDVISCVAALDVLVMCSDHEGLPMTVLEATCLRVPMVGHAVGGIKEVIAAAGSGVLVNENVPERYATAIHALINDGFHVADDALPDKYSAISNARSTYEVYCFLKADSYAR